MNFSPFRPPLRVSLPPWSRHSGPSRSRTSLRFSRLSLSVRHSSSRQGLSLSASPECGGAQLRLPRLRPRRLRRDPRRELLLLLPPTRSTSLRHVLYGASVAPILWCPRAPRCSGFHICPIGHDVSLHHPIPAGLPPPALLHPEKLKGLTSSSRRAAPPVPPPPLSEDPGLSAFRPIRPLPTPPLAPSSAIVHELRPAGVTLPQSTGGPSTPDLPLWLPSFRTRPSPEFWTAEFATPPPRSSHPPVGRWLGLP